VADLELRNPSGGIQLSSGGSAASIDGAGRIASGEAFGQPSLQASVVEAGGVASAEAFGQPVVAPVGGAHNINGAGGISTAEAFGLAAVLAVAVLTGISSGEAFGQPAIQPVVQAAGVGSAEAFGSPTIEAGVQAEGIASEEAFGQPTIETEVVDHEIEDAGGIPSEEAFGGISVSVPTSIEGAGGIESAEAIGSPEVVRRYRGLRVSGYVQVTGRLYVSDQIETTKIHITPQGGFAVKLMNQTGATLKHGTAVSASPSHDESIVPQASEYDCVGAVYMDIPDGGYGWVVTTGIAEFLLKDSTSSTRGYWAKAADTDGRIVVTTAPSGIGALTTAEHFREIGHCLETKSAGTDVLVKVLLHFL